MIIRVRSERAPTGILPSWMKAENSVSTSFHAEQTAGDGGLLPRNAEAPGEGREQDAEAALDGDGLAADHRQERQGLVRQGHESDEDDQGGAHVQHHLQPVADAVADRVDGAVIAVVVAEWGVAALLHRARAAR